MTQTSLIDIQMDDQGLANRSPDIEHEKRVAIFDLLQENHFALKDGTKGPYVLHLKRAERGVVFQIMNEEGQDVALITLPWMRMRRLLKDYFMICESYYRAIREASPEQVETIDMSRRALHDEGAEILQEQLSEQIEMHKETARRLFTLISVLQMRA